MAGGLMQLVAYGAQDVYLTGNPQITFFKVVYRRHTNFSIESIEQTASGSARFGGKVSFPITRNGDLVTKMYLKTTLPAAGGAADYVDRVGHALIKSVELQIGGSKIDKHYGTWLTIWEQLTRKDEHQRSLDQMLDSPITGNQLFVPLQFFCCRNDGLALPLIALQYHDVRVDIELETLANCTFTGGAGATAVLGATTLLVDYIYLDSEERRRFAQASHEYLIEQLQFTGAVNVGTNATSRVRLNFNHPCKELVWVARNYAGATTTQVSKHINFTNNVGGVAAGGVNTVGIAQLQLNGHDRFSEQPGKYFNYVQPYQHHSRTPSAGINVYSFALNPEEHQPSGTCNMSRIDNAQLNITWETAVGPAAGSTCEVYATNYNVLRIMSGMGGLAYSN